MPLNSPLPPLSLGSLPLPPSYTSYPSATEEVLISTPIPFERRLPTGYFIKKSAHATIVLHNQEDDAARPVFGSTRCISGEIAAEHNQTVVSIKAKLQATIHTMTASAGGRTVVMLKDQHTLFERDPPSGANSPGTGGCPGLVPFSFMMPTTFQYEESSTEHPLPPSMRIPVDVDGPSLHLAEIQYSLTFIVANRVSALGFEFATNNHTIRVPFTYMPRTRPRSPAIESSLTNSLKSHPNEWLQATSQLKAKQTDLGHLQFDVFTPSTRMFAIGTTIRFHLHASGNLLAIRELHRIVTTTPPKPKPTSTSPPRPNKLSSLLPPPTIPPLRVVLVRQFVSEPSICNPGQRSVRNVELSVATLRSLPPAIDSKTEERETATLEWEGELDVKREVVAFGSFNAGYLQAKDFIMVTFQPRAVHASKLPDHRLYQTVRIVTDPWIPPTDYLENHHFQQ